MKTPKPSPGKLNVRLPEELKQQLQAYADGVGISANAAIVLAIRNFLPFAIKQAQYLRMAPTKATAAPQAIAAAVPKAAPSATTGRKIGADQPCWCTSGKKYKHCHRRADEGGRLRS